MANLFDKMIEDIKEVNGGKEDEIITALKEKRAELGEEASDEEITEAIRLCMVEHLSGAIGDSEESVVISEEDQEYMEKANASVKEFLNDNNWHYITREPRNDLTVHEMGFGVNNVNLRIRIYVEADPNVCRIEAILPISAETAYEYPLCKILAKENYGRRFGAFKYDERDGEVTYEYSFLAGHGIHKDDLDIYFHAVVGSAVSTYDEIRKFCVGRFKAREVNEILKKVNDLVSDISE